MSEELSSSGIRFDQALLKKHFTNCIAYALYLSPEKQKRRDLRLHNIKMDILLERRRHEKICSRLV
jgi:hypothetical protein